MKSCLDMRVNKTAVNQTMIRRPACWINNNRGIVSTNTTLGATSSANDAKMKGAPDSGLTSSHLERIVDSCARLIICAPISLSIGLCINGLKQKRINRDMYP